MIQYYENKTTGKRFTIVSRDEGKGTIKLKGAHAEFDEPNDPAHFARMNYELRQGDPATDPRLDGKPLDPPPAAPPAPPADAPPAPPVADAPPPPPVPEVPADAPPPPPVADAADVPPPPVEAPPPPPAPPAPPPPPPPAPPPPPPVRPKPTEESHIAHAGTAHEVWWDGAAWVEPWS